jgi:hypothetical protein
MHTLRKLTYIFILTFLPIVAHAADERQERPHWSLEVKGGFFYPDIDNWKTNYGSRKTGHYAATFAYKLIRQLELGIEGGYIKDTGQGFAPLHNTFAGTVTYELFPVNAFLLLRGVFSERQVVVPYVGGGWTRIYYREKVEFQETVKGSADGYNGRAGLQFLLDGLDQSAANSFYLDSGVFHTYLFLEAQRSRVMVDTVSGGSVNIGGTSYLAGFLFEF